MNFGLYLPLLVGLALCNHCRRPADSQAAAQALPAAIAMGLATAIMLLLGGGLLALAGSLGIVLPLALLAVMLQTGSALLLASALQRLAAGPTMQLGLHWTRLLLNSLAAGLPLYYLPSASGPLTSLFACVLSTALFTLLLAQFATLPARLQRCALPAWLHGQRALLPCALIIALALHSLGARLS